MKLRAIGNIHEQFTTPLLIQDSEFGSEMLRITTFDLNEIPRNFNVHKALVCRKSPYFAALESSDEGEKNNVVLKGIMPGAFRQILHWLYADSLRQDKDHHNWKTLITTWAAADRLQMERCKNIVMDELRKELDDCYIPFAGIRLANNLDLPHDSAMVNFLVDQYIYDCVTLDEEVSFDLNNLSEVHGDIADRLVSKMYNQAKAWRTSKEFNSKKPTRPADFNGCAYHEHTVGEKCHLEK